MTDSLTEQKHEQTEPRDISRCIHHHSISERCSKPATHVEVIMLTNSDNKFVFPLCEEHMEMNEDAIEVKKHNGYQKYLKENGFKSIEFITAQDFHE